jgi:hypothetical protein
MAVPPLAPANKAANCPPCDSFMDKMIRYSIWALAVYIIILALYKLFALSKTSPVIIAKETAANLPFKRESTFLPLSQINEGVSWSFVLWIYVDEWNYLYGQRKNILQWGNNLYMYFDEKSNDLTIDIMTIPSMNNNKIVYKNIPLQKWLSIIVVLDNRNLDLFVDGELVVNYLLDEVPLYIPQDLSICEKGGFNGKIGYIQYFSYKLPLFGVAHFQGLEKKFNNKSPVMFLYKPFFYIITFGLKMFFYSFIIFINRFLKKMNSIGLEMIFMILHMIKRFFNKLYDVASRIIT